MIGALKLRSLFLFVLRFRHQERNQLVPMVKGNNELPKCQMLT